MKFKIIFLFSLLFFGCEKIIDNKLPTDQFHNKLILVSTINPDSLFSFHLSRTFFILNQKAPEVDSFQLTLHFDTIVLNYYFRTDDYTYTIPGFQPKPEVEYNIKISAVGFPSISASTKIPSVDFDIDSASQKVRPLGEDSEIPPNVINFSLLDNGNENNFYEILLLKEHNGLFTSNRFSFYTDDPILNLESGLAYEPTSLVFSDQSFNGEIHHFQFRANLGVSTIYNNATQKLEYVEYGRYYLLVRNISKEMFDLKQSLFKHLYNQNLSYNNWQDEWLSTLFKGEPINIYHNIKDGLGVFSSYSQKLIRLEFKQ